MMKIVITRRNPDAQSAESYMRVVFAHITNHIRLAEVRSERRNENEEKITVDYEAQPDTADVNFRREITAAVSLRGNLTLESLEEPRRTIQITGLEMGNRNANATTYSIKPVFARYLVNNPRVLAQCVNGTIVSVRFEFEEVDSGKFQYTGRIAIESVGQAPAIPSAYTAFARILQKDSDLKQDILDPNFLSLSFTMNADGTSGIELRKTAATAQPQPRTSAAK